ncbi:MAG: transglutaminase-like domain-containing protein [Acidimicrobiales bacterium]
MDPDPTSRFGALVGRSDVDVPLDEAVLLIAAHALSGLDVGRERSRLDDIAAGVTHPTVGALRRHLVEELGFAGDRVSYHDPRNSLLPEVLDRRRGIPLTLAVLAMEVGRRCGVPLVGIGMPGHFLVRSEHDDDEFVDLFHGGALLDRAHCRAIFEALGVGVTWDESFLDPVQPRAILVRMLANLAGAYRRVGDRDALRWALGLRLLLPGAVDRDRRELAAFLTAAGRFSEAAAVVEATGEERDQHAAIRLRARLN